MQDIFGSVVFHRTFPMAQCNKGYLQQSRIHHLGCYSPALVLKVLLQRFKLCPSERALSDLVTLALAYGSKPGNTTWNSSADIDGNLIVGLSDLVILAQNYGRTDP